MRKTLNHAVRGVCSVLWATGCWTHIVTFTGPSEARFLGWRAPASILSQAPSALMSRVASSRPKGRAGTGREPEGSRPWSPAATPPRAQVLQPGLWAAPGQGQVGRQSHKYARVELETTGPCPLPLSPGRAAGSTISEDQRQRLQERSNKRSQKKRDTELPLSFSTPNSLLPGIRN